MAQQPASRMHGVTSTETTSGIRVIDNIATNVIGMVCTGDDADVASFPLDTPVFFTSSVTALAKAGTTGTLSRSLNAISDQADCQVIVVRVAEATEEAEQTANIIGTNVDGKPTGLQALKMAQSYTGYQAKILGVPDFSDLNIAKELVVAAKVLNAFCYVAVPADNISEAAAYRENFGEREVMLIDNDFTGFDVETKAMSNAATIARILGARAMLDETIGWHKSISNTLIQGVSGLRLQRSFGLTNPNSDANTLNNHEITTLIRENGFRVWGNRTCDVDPMFAFEVFTRTAQVVKQMIAESFLWAMDKPMHPSLLKDIAAGINAKLADLVFQGRLLYGHVYIEPQANPSQNIGNGMFNIGYEITPVPPLENLGIEQRITDKGFVNLAERVVSFNSDFKPTTV